MSGYSSHWQADRIGRLPRLVVAMLTLFAMIATSLVPPGRARAADSTFLWGVSEGYSSALTQAVDMKAGSMRVVVLWSQVEWGRDYHLPEGQGFIERNVRIQELDAKVLAVANSGLTPCLTLVDAPDWTGDRPRGPLSAANAQLYKEFYVNIVNRYKVAPYNVHCWEIWSEPDGDTSPSAVTSRLSYGSNPTEFAQLLALVGPAIKANDPQATVIMGSMAYDWFKTGTGTSPGFNQGGMFNYSFLPGVVAAGGLNHVDLVAFNAYRAFAPGWEANTAGNDRDVAAKAKAIRDRLASLGVTNKRLIAMEGGVWSFGAEQIPFPTNPNDPGVVMWQAPSDELQTAGVVQTYARARAADLAGLFWYTLIDYDPGKGYGLLNFDLSPKPAVAAYRTTSNYLRGATYSGALAASDVYFGYGEGYRFTRSDGRRVTVVWAAAEPWLYAMMRVASRGDTVKVYSMAGVELRTLPVVDGYATVTTNGNPVFVDEQVTTSRPLVPVQPTDSLVRPTNPTVLPPGITQPDASRGGTVKVIAPATDPNALAVIQPTSSAPQEMSLIVPAPNTGQASVGVRLEPSTSLPAGVSLPTGVTTVAVVNIDVFDATTGALIRNHAEPLRLSMRMTAQQLAECYRGGLALYHVNAAGAVTRVSGATFDCASAIIYAELTETSAYAVGTLPLNRTLIPIAPRAQGAW